MQRITRRVVMWRAFREAGDFVRWPKTGALVTALVAALGGAFASWLHTGAWAVTPFGALGGVAALFVTVFVAKMFTVPIAIANEEIAARALLEQCVKQREDRQREAARLMHEIDFAADMLRRPITNEAEISTWIEDLLAWIVRSQAIVAEIFSESKAKAYMRIFGFSDPMGVGGCYNLKHQNGVKMLREYANRLRGMVNELTPA